MSPLKEEAPHCLFGEHGHMRVHLVAIIAALTFGAARAEGADKDVWPMPKWQKTSPAKAGMNEALLAKAQQYAETGKGSGFIVRHGRLVHAWGDPRRRYDLKSTTKSFGSLALGLAVGDGKVRLEDPATKHHPTLGRPPEENVRSGFIGKITLFHLATQTAGFEKPGGYGKILFEPGTKWHYSDAGPNWLAECLTLRYRTDLQELMFERVFTPIGVSRDDLRWRDNAYRPKKIDDIVNREFGSGIHANVDALARVGLLCLRRGRWQDRQIIPAEYIDLSTRTPREIAGFPVVGNDADTSNHYGLLWWNNNDGALVNVPRDAYWSWGLHDSLIVVIPSLDLVVARAGDDFKGTGWSGKYDKLKPFFEPIVASVKDRPADEAAAPLATSRPPYPPSPVIRGLVWADKKDIVRRAGGSDNWPMTWADDDHLYTAYGDGHGFDPKVKEKLSLGLCRVEGPAHAFRGFNVRSASVEQKGDGARGRKASGMLSVGGRLHMLVRNAGNSQLAWSDDHGATWTWSDWKFTTSFGCPTFLNFGRDYAGARDDYVYVYSFDSNSAYTPSDRMVLARVPKDRVTRRDAYEFFVRLDGRGEPVWSDDVEKRGAVFEHKRRCYRSGITFNAGLKRYLWCQIIPGGDTRFKGGFGVYDAPEPWGPWTTVYYTEQWDVGPGESASIPTKWMSADGRTVHMVFSGGDHFSVRRATLEVADR